MFYNISKHFFQNFMKTKKKIWRKKSVRRAIFRNVEVMVKEGEYFVCNTDAAGSLCDCQGSFYTKNEYKLFYQKLDTEYFFI